MEKISNFFKRLSLTVVSIGILGGVIGAVVACGSSSAGTQTNTPAASNEPSDIQKGLYKGNDKQIDLVALGDSFTSGYTTLEYDGRTEDGDNPNGSYAAYLSRILAEQKTYNPQGRLKSYTNLAVSGAKIADLLSVVDDPANKDVLSNADLFVGTIGINDFLQSVLIGGIPYRVFADLLEGKPLHLESSVDLSSNFGRRYLFSLRINNSFKNVFLGKMEFLFRVAITDGVSVLKQNFKNALEQMKLDFESAIQRLHQKAPKAMIVFNKYIYPFNRYFQSGRNITEIINENDAEYYQSRLGLPSNVKTFHDVYDHVMQSLQIIAEKYPFVVWNDMQKNAEEIADDLVKTGQVNDSAQAISLMQADKADINPSEYAHALMAKELYNDLLSGSLNEKTEVSYFEDIKNDVASSSAALGKTQTMNRIVDFLLKNNTTGENAPPDNALASAIVDLLLRRMLDSINDSFNLSGIDLLTNAFSFESVLAKTPYEGLFSTINSAISNKPVDETGTQKTFDDAFADAFFKLNDKLSDALRTKIIVPGSILPLFSWFGGEKTIGLAEKYLPVSLVNYYRADSSVYGFIPFREFKDNEKTAIKTNLKFIDIDFADQTSFEKAFRKFYEDPANIDKWMAEGSGPIPGSTTDTSLNSLVQQSNSQAEHLRRIAALANGFAVNMPEAFYSNYKAGDTLKPLTLADLQLLDGKFKKIALAK